MSREPRIDAYIAKAQPFARPILERVRARVHAVMPDVEEAMKWSHPTYLRNGKIVLGTAAFKEHVDWLVQCDHEPTGDYHAEAEQIFRADGPTGFFAQGE